MKKESFITLINETIEQTAGHSEVSKENREAIRSQAGLFGDNIDHLIYTFYTINSTIAANGGTPVLKRILHEL